MESSAGGHAGPAPSESGRIHAVESLRAIAAIAILGFHAVFASGLAESGSWLKPYASRLESGVSIFFLISGFLLYRPFARAHLQGSAWPAINRYVSSRLLRIIPAYWVALLLIGIWLGVDSTLDWPGGLVYFGFLQSYSPDTLGGGLLQAWSLVVEMSFYAFLPLYAFAIAAIPARDADARRRNQWLGIGVLIAISVVWNTAILQSVGIESESAGPVVSTLPAFLDQFALGMALALLALGAWPTRTGEPVRIGARGTIVCVAVAAIAFWFASTQLGLAGGFEPITEWQWFAKHWLFSVVALGLLAAAGLGLRGQGINRILELSPLRWLGLVSYGIFLWHLAVLTQFDRWGFGAGFGGPAWLTWCIWVAAALVPIALLAAASWYGVERPALAARNSLAALLLRLPSPRRARAES